MKPAEFSYTRAATLEDALGSFASSTMGRVIAGGQSLGPMLNLRLAEPKQLIDVSRLAELRQARIEGDVLAIGACVTHAEIEDGKIPDVTLGPDADSSRAVLLIARFAIEAPSAAASRTPIQPRIGSQRQSPWTPHCGCRERAGQREIRVSDFVRGPLDTAIGEGEIITHVLVPRLSSGARWGHAKYAKKLGDFAQSMAVAVVDPDASACPRCTGTARRAAETDVQNVRTAGGAGMRTSSAGSGRGDRG